MAFRRHRVCTSFASVHLPNEVQFAGGATDTCIEEHRGSFRLGSSRPRGITIKNRVRPAEPCHAANATLAVESIPRGISFPAGTVFPFFIQKENTMCIPQVAGKSRPIAVLLGGSGIKPKKRQMCALLYPPQIWRRAAAHYCGQVEEINHG
jgi:hypothetical protein